MQRPQTPPATCDDGRMTRADLAKDPDDVAAMFDTVARRYDLTNDVLSGFQSRRWRAAVAHEVAPAPGQRILDLAAGTGTSSVPFARAGAVVVPCDFSLGMLAQGRRQQPGLPFVAGDGLALPFRDEAFDAVTISFGLRNVQATQAGLAELLRVTRPGGRLLVCEFSTPVHPAFRKVYLEYLMTALPRIARRTGSNAEAYVYLAESIAQWPDQEELAAQIYRAGWRQVAFRNLTGGIVALHRAVKPQ